MSTRLENRILAALPLATWLGIALALCGCAASDAGESAKTPGTGELIRDMGQEANGIVHKSAQLATTVGTMTPQNLSEKKPVALSQVEDIRAGAARIEQLAPKAENAAQNDRALIDRLKAEQERHSAAATLTRWATWSFGAAALLGLGWALTRWRQLLAASLAAMVLGILFLLFAQIARTAQQALEIAVWTVSAVGGVWMLVAIGLFIHRLREGMSLEAAGKSTIEDLVPGRQFKTTAGAVSPALSEAEAHDTGA